MSHLLLAARRHHVATPSGSSEPPPPNTAPVVTITSPPAGIATHGSTISLRATVDDDTDSGIVPSWSSSISGPLGEGDLDLIAGVDIPVGTHVLTASATDSGGLTGSATRSVVVTSPAPGPVDPDEDIPWGRFFGGADLYPGFPQSASIAELPRQYLDTTMPDMEGLPYIVVTTPAEADAAFAAVDATGGTVAFKGQFMRYRPPARALVDGNRPPIYNRIVITSANLPAAFPAPGTRITPDIGVQLEGVFVTGVNEPGHSALSFERGPASYGYRIVGVRARMHPDRPVGGTGSAALIQTGLGNTSTEAARCYDIVVDRVYGHVNDDWTMCIRGIRFDGENLGVIDSWFEGFKQVQSDSQAVWANSTKGPLKIVNNYLEGAAEPFMTGGDRRLEAHIHDWKPSDIEFRRNHCRKPSRWNAHARQWGQYARDENYNRGLVVTGYDATTRALSVEGGVFDAAQRGEVYTAYQRYHWIAVIRGGPRDGSCARIGTVAADGLSAVMSTKYNDYPQRPLWNYGAPEPGDIIDVRRGYHWLCKNCFELKDAQRVLIAENVFENSWMGGAQQPTAVVIKSASNGYGSVNEPNGWTRNVTARDNYVLNVYEGIGYLNRDYSSGPTQNIDWDNTLVVSAVPRYFGNLLVRSNGLWLAGDYTRTSRMTTFGFRQASIAFVTPTKGLGPTDLVDYVTCDRILCGRTNEGVIRGNVYQPGRAGWETGVNLPTAEWTDCGAYGETSTAKYPRDTVTGVVTKLSPTAQPFVSPVFDPDDPAFDWSLLPTEEGLIATGAGIDASRLRQRLAGVRGAGIPIERE